MEGNRCSEFLNELLGDCGYRHCEEQLFQAIAERGGAADEAGGGLDGVADAAGEREGCRGRGQGVSARSGSGGVVEGLGGGSEEDGPAGGEVAGGVGRAADEVGVPGGGPGGVGEGGPLGGPGALQMERKAGDGGLDVGNRLDVDVKAGEEGRRGGLRDVGVAGHVCCDRGQGQRGELCGN